jgi:hypothetical protein
MDQPTTISQNLNRIKDQAEKILSQAADNQITIPSDLDDVVRKFIETSIKYNEIEEKGRKHLEKQELKKKQDAAAEEKKKQDAVEEKKKQDAAAEEKKKQDAAAAAEEKKKQDAAAATEEKKKQDAAAAAEEKKKQDAEEKKKQDAATAAAAEEKKKQDAEEKKKQDAAAEEKKKQDAAAEEKKKQDAEEKKKQDAAAEEKKKQDAATAAAEEKKKQDAAAAEEKKKQDAAAEEKKKLDAAAEEKKKLDAAAEEKKKLDAAEEKKKLDAAAEEKKKQDAATAAAAEEKKKQDAATAEEKKNQDLAPQRRLFQFYMNEWSEIHNNNTDQNPNILFLVENIPNNLEIECCSLSTENLDALRTKQQDFIVAINGGFQLLHTTHSDDRFITGNKFQNNKDPERSLGGVKGDAPTETSSIKFDFWNLLSSDRDQNQWTEEAKKLFLRENAEKEYGVIWTTQDSNRRTVHIDTVENFKTNRQIYRDKVLNLLVSGPVLINKGKVNEALDFNNTEIFGKPSNLVGPGEIAPMSFLHGNQKNPRSVIGKYQDGSLFVAVVRGRAGCSSKRCENCGFTFKELQDFFKNHKSETQSPVDTLINLDGGGSSHLLVKDKEAVFTAARTACQWGKTKFENYSIANLLVIKWDDKETEQKRKYALETQKQEQIEKAQKEKEELEQQQLLLQQRREIETKKLAEARKLQELVDLQTEARQKEIERLKSTKFVELIIQLVSDNQSLKSSKINISSKKTLGDLKAEILKLNNKNVDLPVLMTDFKFQDNQKFGQILDSDTLEFIGVNDKDTISYQIMDESEWEP